MAECLTASQEVDGSRPSVRSKDSRMKTCSKCGVQKPLFEFSFVHPAKKDGKLRPDCKECVRARVRAAQPFDAGRMADLKKRSIAAARAHVATFLASHACVDCGEPDPVVLDFDHVRGSKVCDVSRMVAGGYRLRRIDEEIAKCEVRCSNCHRRITAKRRERA